jgi:hypothetical protein
MLQTASRTVSDKSIGWKRFLLMTRHYEKRVSPISDGAIAAERRTNESPAIAVGIARFHRFD